MTTKASNDALNKTILQKLKLKKDHSHPPLVLVKFSYAIW